MAWVVGGIRARAAASYLRADGPSMQNDVAAQVSLRIHSRFHDGVSVSAYPEHEDGLRIHAIPSTQGAIVQQEATNT